MTIEPARLAAAIAAETLGLIQGGPDDPARHRHRIDLARQAMQQGLADKALPLLGAMARRRPADAGLAVLHGVALRLEQRPVEAVEVFAAALAAGARDPALLQGLAQTRYEVGLPAAAAFAEAQAADPANLEILRNRAAAMAGEGDLAGGETLLVAALQGNPGWLDGHKALSVLRWTRGDMARHAESYAEATRVEPANAALWLAWFRAVAQTRDWPAATDILARAAVALGDGPALQVARLFVASESGDDGACDALLAQTAAIQGETINLCRIRHHLRQRRPREAEAVALQQLLGPSAPLFWPYLSLAWRLADDRRAHWLDNPEAFVRAEDVELDAAEYEELAQTLRVLHQTARPYIEQSVRGGTQTDRSIIDHHAPIIRLARQRWLEAIRRYVDALPDFEQGHPLLGLPRGKLMVEGSWSVRLERQGYNVPHNHPVGWLSTAFYIALPDAAAMGPAPAGWFAYGTPPPELALDLPEYGVIEPRVGRTAIFPSTMWHRTWPFDDGERLVMALDIRRPTH